MENKLDIEKQGQELRFTLWDSSQNVVIVLVSLFLVFYLSNCPSMSSLPRSCLQIITTF